MRKKDLEAKLEALAEQMETAEVQAELRESAFMRTLSDENKGWASLDASATKRNRSWSDVEKNLKDAYEAWCVNPLAKSYVDYMRYFVIGKGTQVETDDGDDAVARIEAFTDWCEWSVLEKAICEELSRDGEVFIRFHEGANKYEVESELASLSLVDPMEIQAIDMPEIGKPVKYLRVYTRFDEMDDNGTARTESVREWIPAEQIHHIKINCSHNETRGRSDLLVVLPLLKQLRRWIEDMSRRNYYTGAFNWDVECSGGIKPSAVTAKYPSGPTPGTIIAHTPAEKWTPVSPDMKWTDSAAGAREIKLEIMAGYKEPESWYGDTGESNLATTQALAMPTLKAFTDRQDFLKYHFEQIISRGAKVENVEVSFPELVAEEADKKAQALLALSQAILNLQQAGVLSRESAYEIVREMVEKLDAWSDDQSGVGEKAKIETEEAEETDAAIAGRVIGSQPSVVRAEVAAGSPQAGA